MSRAKEKAKRVEEVSKGQGGLPITGNPIGRSVRVTASFGVAALPGSGTTQVELTAAADDAVYRSKRAGKNRVSLADTHEGDELSVPGSYQ